MIDFIYRFFTFLLGILGAAAALGINIFYSVSTRFQNVVGTQPDPPHGWLGLGCAILAFMGAVLLLFRMSIPAGALMLIIAGIGFFFVVNWWAWLASPAMFLAAFFGLYQYLVHRRAEAAQQGKVPRQEYPPPEGRTPAVG